MIIAGQWRYKYEDFNIDISKATITSNSRGMEQCSTICPRCSSSRKKENQNKHCLWINVTKGLWKCKNCNYSGGLEYGEAGNKLSTPSFSKPSALSTELSVEHFEWLTKERMISPEVIKQAKIKSDGRRIVFPYFRGSEIINYKKRTPQKDGWEVCSGGEQILYGLEQVSSKEPLVFCEGELDALACRTVGFRAVSVFNGKNSNLDCVKDLEKNMPNKIILAGDSDAKEVNNELAHRFGKQNCWVVNWPEGIKDANQYLQEFGIESLSQILAEATPFPIAGIYDVQSVEDEIWDYYDNGLVGGVSTGWECMDNLYTVKEGYWTIVTGVPTSGKSGFLDHMMINLAKNHGWKFGVCSPENQPVSLHFVHLMEKVVGKPFFKGPKERMSIEEAVEAIHWLKQYFYMILPDPKEDGSQVLTIDQILLNFKTCILRYNCKALCIDPYNELEVAKERNQSEHEYINTFITKIRQFARRNGVHIWLVVHPRKPERLPGEDFPVITPNEISGSSSWWSKADNILSLHRTLQPGTPPLVDVHVQKIKPRYVGMTGVATLQYDGASGQYTSEINPEYL